MTTGWCIVISIAQLNARVWKICPSCINNNIPTTIQKAAPFDTLFLETGIYAHKNIIVDKPLTIIGKDAVLDGENKYEIITVTADHVTLDGLILRNAGQSSFKEYAAIRIKRKGFYKIKNIIIENTYFGIYLEYADDGIIENNKINGRAISENSSGNAIHAWYCHRIKVINNTVSGHRDGIYFEFVDSSLIKGNYSYKNVRYGLHFMFSNDDEYTDNTFHDNGAGVAVMFSKRIGMHCNRFEYNWGRTSYGLLLKEIYDADIQDNEFTANTIGILLEGASRIQYHYNTFKQNGWALKMTGGCQDNQISLNNFEGNSLDLVIDGRLNNNTFDDNYWSDYSGYDLNKDGVGDVPHRPVKLYSFILNRAPESIILMRSLFIDLLNFSEKVSPVFTPVNVLDTRPQMQKLNS